MMCHELQIKVGNKGNMLKSKGILFCFLLINKTFSLCTALANLICQWLSSCNRLCHGCNLLVLAGYLQTAEAKLRGAAWPNPL